MLQVLRSLAIFSVVTLAVHAQTMHRSVSSIFANHLASGIAQAGTLTLAPTIRATQPVLQAFVGGQRMSVGTWVEIYGANFAADTNDWGKLFVGDTAPTNIDNTRVTIDGKAAFLYFITPGANGAPSQINALVPDGVGTGNNILLEVTTPVGTASTRVTVSPITPAMLTTPSFNVGGKQYVAALHADNVTFVGKPNLIPGVAFQPAKPGEIIVIYAVGCGPTTPAVPAGKIVPAGVTLANQPQVLFGQTPAPSVLGFMTKDSIGLCQLNVTVPNVADGDIAVSATIGGASDGQNLFTTVQR